jgi:small subunit ribosomal protein S20
LGTKSALKAARASGRRRDRNKSIRSQVKTDIAKAEKLIFDGDLEAAKVAVTEAISALDKAAEKKVLHANNTARRKSRLLKKLNQASAAPKAEVKPKAKAKPKAESKRKTTSRKKAKPKAKEAESEAEKAE